MLILFWMTLLLFGAYAFRGHQIHSRISQLNSFNDDMMIHSTKLWLERVVIKEELCPWAAGVYTPGNLKICVYYDRASQSSSEITESSTEIFDPIKCSNFIIDEIKQINSHEIVAESTYTSTLIIVPQLSKFKMFMEFVYDLEVLLEDTKLDDYIQIATFHPNYIFDGTSKLDVENYTNRSPFPIIHLLRVIDVNNAVSSYNGNTDVIWQNNINKMKEIGLKNMRHIIKQIVIESNDKYSDDNP